MLALKRKIYNLTFQSHILCSIDYISGKRNNSSAYRIPHKVSVPEECPIARKFSVIAGTFAIPGAV
jgi:hypothetical protein